MLLVICKLLIKVTGKQRKEYFDIFEVLQFGIHYSTGGKPLLVGFTDSDWDDDPNDRKSTTGYVFSLGSGPVTWACKKQQDLALS